MTDKNNDVRALLWIFATLFGCSIHIQQINKLKGPQKKVFSRFGIYRDVIFPDERGQIYAYRAGLYFGTKENFMQNLNQEVIDSGQVFKSEGYFGHRVITLPQGLVYFYFPREHESRINKALSSVNNPSLKREDLVSLCREWYTGWDEGRIKRNKDRLRKYLQKQKGTIIDTDNECEVENLRNTWEYWKNATHHDG
ncbi:hypothetical protein A3K73_03360 [Candidatus Pacearchaeota archaeon RBG_13_36_9]|nr:MAG: hypothetical protein A3K73_03360 [Candidatus Pacearchaeota archaeon RBG_13_36_9]